MSKPQTDLDEHLPSYDEVIREDTNQAASRPSQTHPQVPPQAPPRPQVSPQAVPMQGWPQNGFPHPNGFFPSNNFNGSPVSTSHYTTTSSSTTYTSSSQGRKKLPWTYPAGYYCKKCGNTGYKIKNPSEKCKKCWSKFYKPAPRPPQQPQPGQSPAQPTSFYSTHTTHVTHNAPLVLKPGDPRIGGILCPNCNGKGTVRFFLDKEPCPRCMGLGRIFV